MSDDLTKHLAERTDPILKLKAHLERHKNREQAFFSTAGLQTLLDRLEQMRGHNEALESQLAQMRKDAVSVGRDMHRLIEQKVVLEAQVKRLLANESKRITEALMDTGK
jgi:hypothetical protein